jgi:hypothetical protein
VLSSNSFKPALEGFPLASVVGFAVDDDGRYVGYEWRESPPQEIPPPRDSPPPSLLKLTV